MKKLMKIGLATVLVAVFATGIVSVAFGIEGIKVPPGTVAPPSPLTPAQQQLIEKTRQTQLPDLMPAPQWSWITSQTGKKQLTFSIKNQGLADAPVSGVTIKSSQRSGSLHMTVPAVPKGQEVTLKLDLIDDCFRPDCAVTIIADDTTVITESDEGNNSYTFACYPNLYVDYIVLENFSCQKMENSTNLYCAVSVKNIGNACTPEKLLSVSILKVDGQRLLVKQDFLGASIPRPNETKTYNLPLMKNSIPLGSYEVQAQVSSAGPESNTNNNKSINTAKIENP